MFQLKDIYGQTAGPGDQAGFDVVLKRILEQLPFLHGTSRATSSLEPTTTTLTNSMTAMK
jgi:hypothetical protein